MKRYFYSIILGVLLIFSAVCAASASSLYTADENKDGKPDQWYNMDSKTVRHLEADRNFDGKVDYIADFNEKGKMVSQKLDYNYDGVMDDFYYYKDGVLEKQEIDSNYDTKIDIWIYLYKGVYIKKYEKDTDHDGKPDIIKDYEK
ncbi:MAG: hypothetical protein J7K04_01615 [Spirochaetales bacterium]|nr:hypothetical protein [Spirochaetales bacterium]